MKPEVIVFDHRKAERAFRLHRALMRCLRDDPQLAHDELFLIFKQEAFERFERAFWRGE